MTDQPGDSHKVILLTGVAGFIGSQLADVLLEAGHSVVGVDNFSRGVERNLIYARSFPGFELHRVNLANEAEVVEKLAPRLMGRNIAEVWHMAANSDIPAGIRDPHIDLHNTFLSTVHTLMLMRLLEIPRIAFASTSAVYGENPNLLEETTGPLLPISNYGAMKLASEAVISASVEAYLQQAWIFRFPNVVGPRLTHGVIYDFLEKLSGNSAELEVLGNGEQKKPYLHSSDLIEAMLFIRTHGAERLNLYNIGPKDEGATVTEIAEAVLAGVHSNAPIRYTGGDRGWVGDVPRFRYAVKKLAHLGWSCRTSSLETVRRAIAEAIREK